MIARHKAWMAGGVLAASTLLVACGTQGSTAFGSLAAGPGGVLTAVRGWTTGVAAQLPEWAGRPAARPEAQVPSNSQAPVAATTQASAHAAMGAMAYGCHDDH